MTEHICAICHAVTDEPILCASCSAATSDELLEVVGTVPEFSTQCLVCGTVYPEWAEDCPVCAQRRIVALLAPSDGAER